MHALLTKSHVNELTESELALIGGGDQTIRIVSVCNFDSDSSGGETVNCTTTYTEKQD